jgi:Carboxypeptidase regulatory-like domain
MLRLAFTAFLTLSALTPLFAAVASLSGQVKDLNSTLPIAGATVSVDEVDAVSSFNGSTTTDATGTYQIQVPRGDVHIGVTAPGYGYFIDEFTLDSDPYTYNATLQQITGIHGTIRDAHYGNTLESEIVTLLDADTRSRLYTDYTDANGTYSFGVTPYRHYAVCVLNPNDDYLDTCYDSIAVAADGTVNFTQINVSPGQDFSADISLAVASGLNGHLQDRYFNTPIKNAHVTFELYSPQYNQVSRIDTTTDDFGDYALYGIAPGNYYATAGAYWYPRWSEDSVYTPRLYGGGDCSDLVGLSAQQCPFATASLVSVSAGGTGGIDFALFPGYVVSGRVADAFSGLGLANVTVRTCDATSFVFSSSSGTAVTDGNGNYTVAHAAGNGTVAIALNAPGYLNQIWPGSQFPPQSCMEPIGGSPLSFGTSGSVLAPIDFALPRSSSISGTVTAADLTAAPLSAEVELYKIENSSVVYVTSIYSGSDGTYMFPGVGNGNYFVFAAFANGADCQFYDHVACGPNWGTALDFSQATPVVIDADGQPRIGVTCN